MKKQIPIKLSEIDENLKLWRGTKIRLVLDEPYQGEEYWDYMIVLVPDDHDCMILVNVTIDSAKEGAVFREKVKIDHSENSSVVKKESLKEALGEYFENGYLISWDE